MEQSSDASFTLLIELKFSAKLVITLLFSKRKRKPVKKFKSKFPKSSKPSKPTTASKFTPELEAIANSFVDFEKKYMKRGRFNEKMMQQLWINGHAGLIAAKIMKGQFSA